MASTFGGLNICSAGLYSSQTKLYTANVNIANAAVKGYSSQTVEQSCGYTTSVQNGVVVSSVNADALTVSQEQSAYLNQRYWNEMPDLGEWETKSASLAQMETILDELEETGIIAQLDNLDQSLETLSTEPDSMSARTEVIQNTVALCDTMNSTAQQLYDLQSSIENDIEYNVSQINQISGKIASLNGEIMTLELSGGNASALKDERDLLTDTLSELTEITVSEVTVGTTGTGESVTSYLIKTGNSLLVNHDDAQALQSETSLDSNGNRIVTVTWSDSGQVYSPESGTLAGDLDLMNGDGTSGDYKGIPYYMNQLDVFAETLVTEMNAIQVSGYGLDDSTGVPLFDAASLTAMTIHVSDEIVENPEKLAASTSENEAGSAENVTLMLELIDDSSTFDDGSFSDFMSRISTELGSATAYGENRLESATTLTTQIDLSRESITGVSIDEESTELVLQQQIYEATAKMMQVWSEIIETTINQLGG